MNRPFQLCLAIAAVWTIFCGVVFIANGGDAFGDDLEEIYAASASYEQGDRMAIYHPGAAERQGRIPSESGKPLNLGYTQPPILAAMLAPVTARMSFNAFNRLVLFLNILAYAIGLLVALRTWRPEWCRPIQYLGLLALALLSTPFQSAEWMNQIQMVVVLLIVLALMLEERGRSWLAGIAAAVAIMLKISPAVLLIVWLCAGRVRPVAWAIAAGAVLALLNVAACGLPLCLAFLDRLSVLSGELMVALNNQSLVSFCFGLLHPAAYRWQVFPMPVDILWIERISLVAFAAGIAYLTLRLRGDVRLRALTVFCLAATLVVVPLSWDHYSIIVPALLLAVPEAWLKRGSALRWRNKAWLGVAVVIVLLEIFPIAPILIWSKFYAAIILAAAVVVLAPPRVRDNATREQIAG